MLLVLPRYTNWSTSLLRAFIATNCEMNNDLRVNSVDCRRHATFLLRLLGFSPCSLIFGNLYFVDCLDCGILLDN